MNGIKSIEGNVISRIYSNNEIKERLQTYAAPYRELMSYYRCAMMEVSTKFNVLDEELSLQYDRHPIEAIKTRLQSPDSIMAQRSRSGWRPRDMRVHLGYIHAARCAAAAG